MKNTKEALQKFQVIQFHDKIKNKYCKENNITLIRISYKDNVISEMEKFILSATHQYQGL